MAVSGEHNSESYSSPPTPPVRQERDISGLWDGYIDEIPPNLAHSLEQTADDLYTNGNDRYKDTAGAPAQLVPIISGGRSAMYLPDALAQVVARAQEGAVVPTVAVLANYMQGGPYENLAKANIDAVRDVQNQYPWLPLSWATMVHRTRQPIGYVRDVLWGGMGNGYRQSSLANGMPMIDRLVVNLESDTQGLPEGYFTRCNAAYEANNNDLWMGGPLTQHQPLSSEYRRINELLRWHDGVIEVRGTVLPANFATNLGAFAVGEGFGGAALGEHAALLTRARSKAVRRATIDLLADVTVYNSAHALVDKMRRGEESAYGSLYTDRVIDVPVASAEDLGVEYFARELSRLVGLFFDAKFGASVSGFQYSGRSIDETDSWADMEAVRGTRRMVEHSIIPEEVQTIALDALIRRAQTPHWQW